MAGARRTASLEGKLRNPCRTFLEPLWSLVEPCGIFAELCRTCEASGPPRTIPQPSQNLAKPSYGTLPQTTPDRRTSQNLVEPWWNPGGESLKPPPTTPQPLQNLAEPCCNPDGSVVVKQTTPTTPQPLQNLAEPCWNPDGHPRPPHSPCTTWRNPAGTLMELWWNSGGTVVEPSCNLTSTGPPRSPRSWWNFGGTLLEPWSLETLPQTTPVEPL